jgi:hypothetical protein
MEEDHGEKRASSDIWVSFMVTHTYVTVVSFLKEVAMRINLLMCRDYFYQTLYLCFYLLMIVSELEFICIII